MLKHFMELGKEVKQHKVWPERLKNCCFAPLFWFFFNGSHLKFSCYHFLEIMSKINPMIESVMNMVCFSLQDVIQMFVFM